MKRLTVLLCCLIATAAFAQRKPEKALVQFSGIVLVADSTNSIIPYVTISNLSYPKQGTIANYKGYFSFVAHEQDTIRFTSIGYSSTTVVIPSVLADKSYTLQVRLSGESIHLPSVRIFPWATTDEFRKDFLSMKIADDDLEIARKNLTGKSIASLARTLPLDGKEHQGLFFQDEHNAIMNSHSLMPNPLLNPFAWGALLKEITAGDKSRSASAN